MFNYDEYSIGDHVKISSTLIVKTDNGRRAVRRVNINYDLVGQITGVKQFQTGTVKSSGYDEYGCGYLAVETTFLCWEIRTGKKNKPIYAHAEDLKLVSVNKVQEISNLYTRQPAWTEHSRKIMSEESESFPRDPKGRFACT